MREKTLASFTSILISVTEGCKVGCAHCGYIGTKRENETSIEDISRWVVSACEYRIPSIIFTGGEPFERFEVLRSGVTTAFEHDTASALFTSSFWAGSLPETRSHLEQLPGLRHLYLSTDVYHQKTVPYENVRNVIRAADELGIPLVTLCVCYTTQTDLDAVKAEYQEFQGRVRFYETRVIPTPYIERVLKGQDSTIPAREENFETSCFLDTPIVNANGDLFACHIGKVGGVADMEHLPYWLGNLGRESFSRIMSRARYKVEYQFLRTHGPRGIARLFEEYPELASATGRDSFVEPCDLCFSALATHEGRRCLREFTARPEIQEEINIRLALRFGELPVDFAAQALIELEAS